MKMTLTPSAFRPAMTRNRRSVSAIVRLEVGSSMITRRAFSDSALAISTSCRWASDRLSTIASAPKSQPSRSSNGRTRWCSACVSTSFRKPPASGSRPMNTLAATSRFSNRLSSWWTKAMPAASASCTVSAWRSTPSVRIVPESGATTPPSTFISVDLPAPFSPTRPMTSPRSTERLTASSATTPG